MFLKIIGLLIHLIALPVTIYLALLLVPGLAIEGRFLAFLFILLVTVMNYLLKPLLNLSSVGCSILALAPILLVANTMALWSCRIIPFGVVVQDFWAAFWGGLLISVVASILNFRSGNL
jgi:putative membrane protein